MLRVLITSATIGVMAITMGGCPSNSTPTSETNDAVAGACLDRNDLEMDEATDEMIFGESVEDDAVTCPGYDASLDPELAKAIEESKGDLTSSGRRDWTTVPGSQQPVLRRRTDDRRTFKFYTAEVVNSQTGEHGVVVSVWRSNRRAWERRIFTCRDLNELGACETIFRRAQLRSWFGDLIDGVRDIFNDIKDLVSEFKDVLAAIADTLARFGRALLAAAKEIDPNVAGRYAKAVSEVQSQPTPLHIKMQYVIDRTTSLDPSGRSARAMGLAILRAN